MQKEFTHRFMSLFFFFFQFKKVAVKQQEYTIKSNGFFNTKKMFIQKPFSVFRSFHTQVERERIEKEKPAQNPLPLSLQSFFHTQNRRNNFDRLS
jgi:hypothetical protein